MTNRIFRVRTLGLAALAVALTPLAAQAQTLPDASTVVKRYVEAIGGREAVLAPQASRAVGTFEIAAAGLKGDLEIVSQSPNRMVSRVNIPGMGLMRSGFDGKVGWSLDPIQGARVMSGPELDAMRDQANPLAAVRDASLFTSMQTVERTEVGGASCYKVRFVWKSGRESHDCYSAESGLLIATFGEMESPMGKVQVTNLMSDYREFRGVKMPTRMVQEMMGMQQVMTISEVQYEGIDLSLLDTPAEIRALIQGS